MRRSLRNTKKRLYSSDERKVVIYGAMWLFSFVVLLLGVLFIRSCTLQERAEKELQLKLVFDDTYLVRVHNHITNKTETVKLEEYIYHVVAGEMPAAYDIEALKAQATAARTYTVQKCKSIIGDSAKGCKKGDWDVCTDSSCCQTWRSDEKMKQHWGRHYAEYALKIYTAVDETRGEILTFGGKPINAMYHSSSGGYTENIEDIYGGDPVPYLKSVDSPGEENFSDYASTVKLTLRDAAKALNDEFGTKLTAEKLKDNITITKKSSGGAVISAKIGTKEVTGRQIRHAFSLKSCKFSISFDEKHVIISVQGFGHGVGMSQTGAGAMAKAGSSYSEILLHYYTDVTLEKIGDLK